MGCYSLAGTARAAETRGKEMNVKQITEKYLQDNGYDGLYSDLYGCACETNDLFPCDCNVGECEPGYRVDYPDGKCPCGQGCDFHIEERK